MIQKLFVFNCAKGDEAEFMVKRRNRKYILVFIVACMFGIFFVGDVDFRSFFHPSGTNEPQLSKDKLVADLGGMHVAIPGYFAKYVEFNGDPGWGEERENSSTNNAAFPKLRSFGFDVRYPDMVGLSSPEMNEDKRKTTIFKTMWIRVGVNTGEIYSGDEFLDRIVEAALRVEKNTPPYKVYEMLKENVNNLTVYAPVGMNPSTNNPYRQDPFSKDIFISRDSSGKIITYISCSNAVGQSAPCRQVFRLNGPAKAKIYFSYRRGLLPEWENMQKAVNSLILSFEIK